MNELERIWKYGRICREIHEVGMEIMEYLDAHCPGHQITLVPKEDKDNERDHDHNG